MVKYTAILPWIGLSESDSKLYTNLEICEGKNHKHLRNHVDLQSQAMYVNHKKQQKINIKNSKDNHNYVF